MRPPPWIHNVPNWNWDFFEEKNVPPPHLGIAWPYHLPWQNSKVTERYNEINAKPALTEVEVKV